MASLSASLKVTRSPPSLGTRAPGSCSAAESTRSARSVTATSSLSEVCSVRTRTATPSVQPTLNVPPRFRDSAFFDKGENAVMKIPFTGNPKPKIVWKKDGQHVESGCHFAVKTEDRHALLTITDRG